MLYMGIGMGGHMAEMREVLGSRIASYSSPRVSISRRLRSILRFRDGCLFRLSR